MVCALGSGRMAALARLLTARSLSKTIADDFGHQKLAAQYIHRELQEANEANLIDEQDMHIFDLQPLADPLNLVSCNACRKPIKASQYANHAELCTSLTSLEEIGLELDGNAGRKKPPRKERRKLPVVHSTTSVGERDKHKHLDASNVSASDSKLEATSAEAKSTFYGSSGGPLMLKCSDVSPRNVNSLAITIPRPRKRFKMVAAEGPGSDMISQETISCSEQPRSLETGTEKVSDLIVEEHICRQINELHSRNTVITDVPVPLATKIYYSQRNNRLRSALGHLYYDNQTEYCSVIVHGKVLRDNAVTTLTSSPNSFSLDQISDDHQLDKEGDRPTNAVHNQAVAQSSELYSCRPEGFPPTMSISNQFSVNNVLGPHTSLGNISSNYFSSSYTFADSSGKSIGSMQQPEGSVSVV